MCSLSLIYYLFVNNLTLKNLPNDSWLNQYQWTNQINSFVHLEITFQMRSYYFCTMHYLVSFISLHGFPKMNQPTYFPLTSQLIHLPSTSSHQPFREKSIIDWAVLGTNSYNNSKVISLFYIAHKLCVMQSCLFILVYFLVTSLFYIAHKLFGVHLLHLVLDYFSLKC